MLYLQHRKSWVEKSNAHTSTSARAITLLPSLAQLGALALIFISSTTLLAISSATAQDYSKAVPQNPVAKRPANPNDVGWSCATSDQAVRTIRLCTPKINNPETSDKRRMRYLFKRAKAWVVEEELWAAINDYGRIIEIAPTKEQAYSERAKLYEELKEFELARADYTQLIKLDPKNVSAYCRRGVTKVHLKKYDSAIEDHTTGLKIDPTRVDCKVARGDAWAAAGKDANALSDYSDAVADNRQYPNAYFRLAKLHERRGELELAIKNYWTVITINPIHMRARKELQALGILPP